MKVLFIGGSSLLLKDLVKKYVKEGHYVHIIDKKVGDYSDITDDHVTINKISPKDPACEEVFKSNVFDSMFFISNRKDSNYDELPTLINILNCSVNGVVEKFIYFSSEDVYGEKLNTTFTEGVECKPVGDYSFNKLKCEEYLAHYSKKNNLESLIIRLGMVYGPDNKIRYDKLEEEMFDWMYVTDVVEAIHKLDESGKGGIFNISNKVSMEKIKNTIDWTPIISIEEGIRLAIKGSKGGKKEEVKEKKQRGKFTSTILATIYGLLLFTVFALLEQFMGNKFTMSEAPIMYIYVIIISVLYGINGALFSSALVTIYEAINYTFIGEKDIITLLLDYRFTVEMLLILVVGLFVGYAIEKRNLINENLENDMKLFSKKYNFLKEVSAKTFTDKVKLERKILNSNDSVGKIYGIVKELDSLEPTDLLNKSIEVLEKILNNKTISIYTMDTNNQYLRLQFKSSDENYVPRKSLKVEEEYYLGSLNNKEELFVNKALDGAYPDMAGAIKLGDKLIGVVIVDKVQFEDLSLEYENLFRATLSLISASLTKGLTYQNAINEEKFIDGTEVLKNRYFEEVLAVKINSQIDNKSTMALIEVKNTNFDMKEFSTLLSSRLRESDVIGLGRNDEIRVLLNNSNNKDKEIVVERLEKIGLKVMDVDMEGIYDSNIDN